MIKYLITGGCGFIGSHLMDLLLKKGHAVRILDDFSNPIQKKPPAEVEVIQGSITDSLQWAKALKGIEGVFHLAAKTSVVDSIQNWHKNHLINSGGTVSLLEHLQGIPLVYTSSAAVYGDNIKLPLQETHLPRPLSPYAVDKFSNELNAKIAWQTTKTPSTGFRLFNIYGPHQNPNSSYSGVISIFAEKILKKQPITLFGDGKQSRDFVYVKDVAEILLKGMETTKQKASLYNLCTGTSTSLLDLIDLMGQIAQLEVQKQFAEARPLEVLCSQGDPEKLLHSLNIKPQISLKKGLTDLMREIAPPAIVR